MKPVKGVKITLQDVLDSNPVSAFNTDWVIPARATILSGGSGTLIETAENKLYLVSKGDWFRSDFYLKGIPQVSMFNQLQDLGFTEIKDKIVRNPEPMKENDGQEIRGENNVSIAKTDKTVASNRSKKKNS